MNLFILANIIINPKKFSQLLSGSSNLLAVILAFNNFESILESIDSLSEKIELNKIKIDGILNSFLSSVLFNRVNIITQIWDGFKKYKKSIS